MVQWKLIAVAGSRDHGPARSRVDHRFDKKGWRIERIVRSEIVAEAGIDYHRFSDGFRFRENKFHCFGNGRFPIVAVEIRRNYNEFCQGSHSAKIPGGKTVSSGNSTDFDLVVVNAGSDFALVLRASDATLSGNGTKVEGQGACTPSILTGTYGYQGDGVVAMDGKAVSTAEIGILTFDGKGAFSGTSSLISAGQSTRQSFTGTYELTDICFAAAVYKVGDVAYQMNFMVTGGGNQILYSELASGYVATGAGTRTFPK